MKDEMEKRRRVLRESDPVYLAHGVENISVLFMLLIVFFQIIGAIGLLIFNAINIFKLNNDFNYDVSANVWWVLFMILSIIGYSKVLNSAYKLALKEKGNNGAGKTTQKTKYPILRVVVIPLNSILDILVTVMLVTRILLWTFAH